MYSEYTINLQTLLLEIHFERAILRFPPENLCPCDKLHAPYINKKWICY